MKGLLGRDLTPDFRQFEGDVREGCRATLGDEEFTTLDLEEFSIYRSGQPSAFQGNCGRNGQEGELASLQEICARDRVVLYFDGIISYAGRRRYVQKVPFERLSNGAYEDTTLHTVGDSLWIQSKVGETSDIWYCLRRPSLEYRRFHVKYLWLADLAKHMTDYLYHHKGICLNDFRLRFHDWLQCEHGPEPAFQKWLSLYKAVDFRRAISRYSRFLWNEASQLSPEYGKHPFWDEIDAGAIPRQLRITPCEKHQTFECYSENCPQKTVVTPYVYSCFERLDLTHYLEKTKQLVSSPSIDHRDMTDMLKLGKLCTNNPGLVVVGDVVQLKSDAKEVSQWMTSNEYMYAYVQKIEETKTGPCLKVIWLFQPNETTCQFMHYPYAKELFFSNMCNCSDHPISTDEVIRKTSIDFFGTPENSKADFFVRQKYNDTEASFVTVKSKDLRCSCGFDQVEDNEFLVGDTVLIRNATLSPPVLDPVIIVEYAPDGLAEAVRVRVLERATACGRQDAEPNELVYTENLIDIGLKDIFWSCEVRVYTLQDRENGKIPPPYSRQGSANAFYLIYRKTGITDMTLEPVYESDLRKFNQGFDPLAEAQFPKMKSLALFCGGGNYDRGLEECGAITTKYAVDFNKAAMHTFRANLNHPDDANLYCGSVNDFFGIALSGKKHPLVARPGEVDVITAGSPCQGFSVANNNRHSEKSLRNQSMVASVVSFVDAYRPKYAILENAREMAICSQKGQSRNMYSQIVCALVGIGYQVKQFNLDAWNYGGPQSRSRLFIVATAPGLVPLEDPPHSHAHPLKMYNRSLGTLANGKTFGDRVWQGTPRDIHRMVDVAPFNFVTIGEATKDLPSNYDGLITCIPHPDHCPSRNETMFTRNICSSIPVNPPGLGFVQAYAMKRMPQPQIAAFNWYQKARSRPESRCWQRVKPNALMPTITTRVSPGDGYGGSVIHWYDSRCISVMEVRRAQGFPDHEVIIGLPATQYHVVGNSVSRHVALALGMSLRKAWIANNSPKETHGFAVEGGTIDSKTRNMMTEHGTPKTLSNSVVSFPSGITTNSQKSLKRKLGMFTTSSTSTSSSDNAQINGYISGVTNKRLRSSSSTEAFTALPRRKRRTGNQGLLTPQHQAQTNGNHPIYISSDSDDIRTSGSLNRHRALSQQPHGISPHHQELPSREVHSSRTERTAQDGIHRGIKVSETTVRGRDG